MALRDHNEIVLEEFNGLWDRGGEEAVPIDHFGDCNNIKYLESGFQTRNGLATHIPGVSNIIRAYNYKMQNAESLIVLDAAGNIYHILEDGTDTVYGPILSIAAMDDFGFVAINGFAYINPFEIYVDTDGVNRARGVENEFLYVYLGAGAVARKAAGVAPTGTSLTVAESAGAGFSELGFHLFGVVYETDSGYLSPPGPTLFTGATSVSNVKGYDISVVTVSPSAAVTKRHIVATKRIVNYEGDQDGTQFFFVPNGNIDDNTTTTISVDFYDIDLLTDASHLIDNFTEIPAGVGLSTYHGRLVTTSEFDNVSLARLSAVGEPEAINQVDGFIIIPLDGRNVTATQEFRDVLYFFKQIRTYAVVDNRDEPVHWTVTLIDNGIGAPVHGIGEVLDSGGVNVDMLLIADFSGVLIFNGAYGRPELSWKIQDRWLAFDRNLFHRIQVMNDTIGQTIFLTLPDQTMLIGDYSDGLDPQNIKWGPWTFDVKANTIALIATNTLIIGSEGSV